ncbi:MAG: hypothetical protein Q8O86_07665 [Dehalococcoidia bacterium]|nr:hypothetical protein [Dehalococcoidia bacterium]
MFPELMVALVAFAVMVVAWVVLPTKSRSRQEEGASEIEPA